MNSIAPNRSIEIPTAKKVKLTLTGFLKLERIERPTVAGNFEVAGNLTVKGTTTTVASVDVETKDRNLTLAKVAAGSLVLKNVPSNVTVAGIPAKEIK